MSHLIATLGPPIKTGTGDAMIACNTLSHLLVRLKEPWWTPLPPSEYVIKTTDGKMAGVGLIVEQDFDAWNLAIALSGSSKPPVDLDGHRTLLCLFVEARQQIAPTLVLGQTLGSFATLMTPAVFEQWLRDLPRRALDVPLRRRLIHGLAALRVEGEGGLGVKALQHGL